MFYYCTSKEKWVDKLVSKEESGPWACQQSGGKRTNKKHWYFGT